MIFTFIKKSFVVGLAVILLCNFGLAQKSKKTDMAEVQFMRGLVKVKKNNCEEAIKDFSKGIEINPRDARFYKERGNCLSIGKRYDEALADFNKAIELKPENAEFYFERAMLFYEISLNNPSCQLLNKSLINLISE